MVYHFEFYWFPDGRKALVKRNNRTSAADAAAAARALPGWRRFWEFEVMENAAFGTLCRIGRARPSLVPALNRFSSAALSSRSYSDMSHRVFVTPRRVRFAESEYAVPRESLGHVIAELRRAVPRLPEPVMFPVEVRVAAADDIWLSTAYGRESAYVAIHQYAGLPYRAYFDRFESIVAEVAGRPHWASSTRFTPNVSVVDRALTSSAGSAPRSTPGQVRQLLPDPGPRGRSRLATESLR